MNCCEYDGPCSLNFSDSVYSGHDHQSVDARTLRHFQQRPFDAAADVGDVAAPEVAAGRRKSHEGDKEGHLAARND